jgi:hypothetical protein
MRTTVRIDDDLLLELRERADSEKESLTRYLNRVLRAGLSSLKGKSESRSRRFRQRTFAMGAPRVDLNKALALAAALEDEEILSKLASGK